MRLSGFRHFKLGVVARLLYAAVFVIWLLALLIAIWWAEPRSLAHAFRMGLVQGFALALIAPWLAVYLGAMTWSLVVESTLYRSLMAHGRGGSSRFAGPIAALRRNWRFTRKEAPIYLGRTRAKFDPTPGGQPVGVDDENHLVTIAMPGAGKSVTAIWPNLIRHPYPDSVFILDPKGEHTEGTAEARAKQGPVYVLDPFGQTAGVPTHSFNPLDEIDITAGDAKERLNELADACYVAGAASKDHPHFKDICIAAIAGFCAHVKSVYPPEMHNLPTVYDLIMKGKVDGGPESRPGEAFERLLDEMSRNPAAGEAPMEAARALRSAGPNEYGSIFTTLIRCIRWVASTDMRKHLMRSDFRLAELREKVCTLYVVLDFADMAPEKQGRYMRVLMYLAMYAARKTPLPAAREAAGRRTLFILDEVGMLGRMEAIERNYKILRGARVKLWSLFQEYRTMELIFENPDALMAASTKQLFGIGDMRSAEQLAKYLGSFVDRFPSGQGNGGGRYEQTKPLLDAVEISDTLRQKAMVQIVVTGGGDRFMLTREPCFPKPRPRKPAKRALPPVPAPEPVTPALPLGGPPALAATPEEAVAMRVLGLEPGFGFDELERRRAAFDGEAGRSKAMGRVLDASYDVLFDKLISGGAYRSSKIKAALKVP